MCRSVAGGAASQIGVQYVSEHSRRLGLSVHEANTKEAGTYKASTNEASTTDSNTNDSHTRGSGSNDQVLALKYRPSDFDEVVGQAHALKVLAYALQSGRLHNAYLFSGTRGVGKTTLARIFAKSLNCDQGVSVTPCQVCQSCIQLKEGRFVDLVEVDAASKTRVEDTRELLENVPYAPTQGRFKIYLIDEVHMLSNHSFNALLKTLEEPPAHVKFLLATTDPQKLPITILSRCLHLRLKPLLVSEIEQHIQHVLKNEDIRFDVDAVSEVAKAAKGSVRDALTITEQAIGYGGGELSFDEIKDLLGIADTRKILALIQAVLAGQSEAAFSALAALAQSSLDLQQVIDALIQFMHAVSKVQAFGVEAADAYAEIKSDVMLELAGQMTPEFIQVSLQVLFQSLKDLPFSNNPLLVLEMAVMRMVYFAPVEQSGEENTVNSAKPPVSQQPVQAARQQAAEIQASSVDRPELSEPRGAVPEQKPDGATFDLESWAKGLQDLEKAGELKGGLGHVLFTAKIRVHEPSKQGDLVLDFMLSPNDQFMFTDMVKDRATKTAQRLLGSVGIHWLFQESDLDSAKALIERKRLQMQRAGADHLEGYPLTKSLKQSFDAELVLNSVTSNEPSP